jgi:hypothetical protein
MKKICILLLITCSRLYTQAQACPWFPADCPADQLGDSVERLNNPVAPQEISMEFRMHDFLTDQMQMLADKKKWELHPYDESHGTGFLNADRSGPLAFNLRPPHEYEISFIFIVNADSLRAWQEWQKEFILDMAAQAEKISQGNNDFSAITKMQDSQKRITERFRRASMIRVKFVLNAADGATLSSIQDNMHPTGSLAVPHAVLAMEAHNNQTDERTIFDLNQFTRTGDLAFILFGNWNLKPNAYQYYYPVYKADRKNMDLVTPKNITSDKIRTIVMHVEGAPAYLHQFLQTLDTDKLNQIITP